MLNVRTISRKHTNNVSYLKEYSENTSTIARKASN